MIEKIKWLIKNDKVKIFVIFAMFTVLGCFPYLNKLPLFAHDLSYHLNRIESIALGLSEGQFPVLIHTNLVNGLRIC